MTGTDWVGHDGQTPATERENALARRVGELEEAIKWVIRYHSPKSWSKEEDERWIRWTGREDWTHGALCDQLRRILYP